MRKLLFLALTFAICGTSLSLEAARRSQQQTLTVVKLSDTEVLALLTPDERAQWDGAQLDLKKAENDMRSAQWLLDRTPGDGAVKLDVSGAHKAGRDQMAAAKAAQAAAQAALQKLRMIAQKRADDIAINGPTYAYEKAELTAIDWKTFCNEQVADFLNSLRAQNYNTFYFSGMVAWKDGAYVPAGPKNDDLTAALITADGKNYSLLVSKSFSLKAEKGEPMVVAEGLLVPPVPSQTAIIVAEVLNVDGLPALLSLRAVDFATWKVIDSRTYQLKEDKDLPDMTLSFADKAKFLDVIAAQPNTFLFQLSFANPKADLARVASVLFKDAALDIKGANITDGDFFELAFAKPEGAPADIHPKAVNVLWKVDPTKPTVDSAATQKAAAEAAKKTMTSRERKEAEAKVKAQQEAAAKQPPEKKPIVLFTTPLSAYNVLIKSALDVGKFEASVPPAEAPAAPAAPAAAEKATQTPASAAATPKK